MKVIEVVPVHQRQQNRLNYYTIVGAVQRSGVFHTEKNTIPLAELIVAAGGLVDANQSSIRVIRNGQNGLQLYYVQDRESRQEIQSGDIIVVVPAPGQFSMGTPEGRYVPVVCIGLSDRPVVLPLSVSIRNLDGLLVKLNQPLAVKSSVRLLDPFGNHRFEELLPGSVLYFDSQSIDRNALAQIEAFPPAVSLTKSESTQGIPESPPRLQTEPEPQSTMQIRSSHEGSEFSVGERNKPHQLLLTSQQETVLAELETTPLALLSPQDLPIAGRKPVVEEVPPRSAIEDLNSPGTIPGTLHPILDVTSELINENSPAIPQQIPGVPAELSVEVEREGERLAPPPPAETRQMRRFENTPVAGELAHSKVLQQSALQNATDLPVPISSENEKASPSVLAGASNLIAIVIAFATLAVLCLVGLNVWTRQVRQKMHTLQIAAHAAQTSQVTQPIRPNAEISSTTTESLRLAMILNRDTPLIEEVVDLPRDIPLHGEPVGQRRIMVHEQNQELRGPHFTHKKRSSIGSRALAKEAAKQAVESVSGEERITESDSAEHRVVFRYDDQAETRQERVAVPQPIRTQRPAASVTQSVSEDMQTSPYDVVEPFVTATDEFSGGPLERALRILAREKKSN